MRKPAPEEAVAARHAIYRRHGRGERLRDARRELGRDALVGVEAKHPVVLCLVDRELLLAPEAEPLLLHDARAVAPGDLERAVAGIRIDDQDLVGELQALEAGIEHRGGVARDQHGRERCAGRGAQILILIPYNRGQ